MLNLVFWGNSRRTKQAHEAPWQMATPLVLLAIGTLVSWLAIGVLTRSYASFGFLNVQGLSIESFIVETFSTPVVWISFAAFALGIGLFYLRKKYIASKIGAQTVLVAQKGYGFDAFYGGIIQCLRGFAARFRKSHTGDLNYNIAGIVLGFLILLVFVIAFIGGS